MTAWAWHPSKISGACASEVQSPVATIVTLPSDTP